jgi:NAD(P)-dependent dehydrogenase (short-subunit alcohol dehydrogenase family)
MLVHTLVRLSSTARLSAIVACAICFALPVVFAARQGARAPAADSAAKRTVLVTGANRGIGLEFAKQYQAAGWSVIATAREPEKADELKALGVRIEALDVADVKSVTALAERLKDQPIDLLINNAGVGSIDAKKLQDIDLAAYERVFQVNAFGPMRVTQALLPNLRAGKGKQVVSISSQLGSIANNSGGNYYAYRESKAALVMFMRSLAAELKSEDFVCIAMSPGWVKTDMGGPNATLTPEQSITGMRKVFDALKPEDSGKSWFYDGTILPW